MVKMDNALKEVLEELKEKYRNGNRKALSEILALLRKDIFHLLERGLSVKTTKNIVEKAVGVELKYDSFYKWVQRNIQQPKQKKTPSKLKKEVNDEAKIKTERKKSIEEQMDMKISPKEVRNDRYGQT